MNNNNPSHKFPVEILDKRIKDGFFGGRKYFATFRFLPFEGMINHGAEVNECLVSLTTYYNIKVGQEYALTFYQHADSHWYPWEETAP